MWFKLKKSDLNMAGLCGLSKGSRWKNGAPWDGLDGVGYGLGYHELVHLIFLFFLNVGLLLFT